MTDGATLVAISPVATWERVQSAIGRSAPHGTVYRWAAGEHTDYGFLVLGVESDGIAVPHLAFRPRGRPMRLPGQPDVGTGTVFVVANNVLNGRDSEFDSWYDNIHIPHTFEYFGFTAARRYTAIDSLGVLQRMVIYASPPDRRAVENAMAWAAEDRELAASQGREPLVPVSEAVIAPRHAGFYVPFE